FISFFFSLIRLPPSPTLFPYTTLFRSLIIFEIMRSFFLGSKEQATNLAALHWWASARNLRTLAVSVSALLHFDFDCFWLRHGARSEEHTSELQSRSDLVCRLLLEKKK